MYFTIKLNRIKEQHNSITKRPTLSPPKKATKRVCSPRGIRILILAIGKEAIICWRYKMKKSDFEKIKISCEHF